MAPRSHGSARTSGSTVLQGPARPRVQTPRRGGSGPTRPRPAAWTCSVRPVAPQPLLPRAASPALWSPCAHPQHGPAHSHPTGPSRTVGATALALRSGELCDWHTSASAALQRPRPAASAQAPRGRVAAGLLQSRGHPHEHLLHLHTRSTRALRLPALSPRPRSAARPHFRHFSASASDVQTAPR